MDESILVTGGTGFVGSYLLRQLLRQGYSNIHATKRANSKMDLVTDFQKHINWIEADILDVIAIEDALEGKDKVYHCAGFVSHLSKDFDKMIEINVEGTANVVNLALEKGVKKLLHFSSIAAIGRVKNNSTIDEKSKWQRSHMNSNYAISKYLAEQEVWRATAEGLNTIIINPSVILGSGDWETGTASFYKTVWNGLKFYTTGTSGYVDVRDVVRMAIELMESDYQEERFICTSENWTYQQLFTTIAEQLDKKPPGIKVNALLREIAWRVEWVKSLVGFRPIVTKETARHSSRSFYYKNDKSREKLNFEYIPIQKTITDTAKTFLASKNGKGWKPALLD